MGERDTQKNNKDREVKGYQRITEAIVKGWELKDFDVRVSEVLGN